MTGVSPRDYDYLTRVERQGFYDVLERIKRR